MAPFAQLGALLPRYAFFQTPSNYAIGRKTWAALAAPTAFTFGADLYGEYEGGGSRLGWGDLWEDDFSMGRVLIMLAADTALYGLLAWYLEMVLPGQYGGHLPPWFLLTPSYWRRTTWRTWSGGGGRGEEVKPKEVMGIETEGEEEAAAAADAAADEADAVIDPACRSNATSNAASSSSSSSSLPPWAEVRRLRKRYGSHVALRGLSLALREGQVVGLLGHNGAGKSTAISCITGLVSPSAGDVALLGSSMRFDPASARLSLGFCPQQDMLFGWMSCHEHLALFSALKGLGPEEAKRAAEAMLEEVGLGAKRDALSGALSGGMRRRLQVTR